MKIPFLSKPEPEYNFHNDETLHSQAPGTLAFGLHDIAPAVKLGATKLFNPSGIPALAKEELPKLDINDPLSKKVTKQMVTTLWGSMLHPPLSYRGKEFQYRTPDGSYNNIMYPDLGKAGLPYAKTVQGKQALHGARPDPGDIFDLLMARNDDGVESYTGISSLLLYQATLVIHDIFRTDDGDINKSKTSSYLDLAPLYGNSRAEQEDVRLMTDGLLKPDTFAEDRLLDQPPGVCIFIIMYNRFHNYVAQQLLEINENGKFSLPAGYQALKDTPESERDFSKTKITEEDFKKALVQLDEDLFQTARLITCGLYAQIAIHDYLRCLMRMHEKNTPWTLDPRGVYPEVDNQKGLQRGEGNMVSVEFNLLYRFHSPLSERDRKWSEEAFVSLMSIPPHPKPEGWTPYVVEDGTPLSHEDVAAGIKITKQGVRDGEVPVPKFQEILQGLKKMVASDAYKQQKKGAFFPVGLDRVGAGNGRFDFRFKRDPKTGMFNDAELAAEMVRVIEDPINHYGAQNIPKVFRSIEVLGILQARKWEVATLNEFREFFGMSRHKNFEDINTDKNIQNALRDLYEDPDQVELYPGIYCEGDGRNVDPDEKMPNAAGSALWRGIFSDAVTLVRSDRFYNLDWNVQSLTAWGMREVTSDPKVNKGSCFHKLFQRAFPGYFTYNSLHMWQPFFTPTKNAYLAEQQGYIDSLDLSGLEWVSRDQGRKPGVAAKFPNGSISSAISFQKECYPNVKNPPVKLLRKRLESNPAWSPEDPWRGTELIKPAFNPVVVSSYSDIQEKILGGPTSSKWINPAILEVEDIPEGSLRDILTNKFKPGWKSVIEIIEKTIKQQTTDPTKDQFLAYFVGLAGDIRRREERSFQYLKGQAPWETKPARPISSNPNVENKKKVKQLDIVKDYSIPLVTRFMADFLGFYGSVKTDLNEAAKHREYTENQIYQDIENCQNFGSYDLDPTKTLERRQAFKKSIAKLHNLTLAGVAKSEKYGFWSEEPTAFSSGRIYGDEDEVKLQPYVIQIRKLAVKIIQALEAADYPREMVAAIMLATALDAAHKVVLTFTEVLGYFVDPKQQGNTKQEKALVWDRWANLQKLARQNTTESDKIITKHVLEAQRLTHNLKLVRKWSPGKSTVPIDNITGTQIDQYGVPQSKKVEAGDTVLVDLYAASHDKSVFPDPYKFDINRKTSYLIYGNNTDAQDREKSTHTFSKYLSLTAMTGMLKHIAMLKNLRVAHDKLGRLKKVKTPSGIQFDVTEPQVSRKRGYEKISTIGNLERYCSTQWDLLLPTPVTWNLRYDNEGEGVYKGYDNANQGHGMDQIYQILEDVTLPSKEEEEDEKKKNEAVTTTAKGAQLGDVRYYKSSADRAVTTTTREVKDGRW